MKLRRLLHPRSSFPFAAAIVALLAAPCVQAASQTWDGVASPGTTGTGTAWLTNTNWAGDPLAANIPGSATGTTNTDIATFAAAGTGNPIGINMNTTGGVYYLGAIELTSASALRNIGNSSSALAGTMTLNGATVNSITNTILSNAGSGLLTLQATQTGTMGLALGNATNNIIQITGAGGITISSNITGASRKLTLQGGGTGVLALSGTNTYSGGTDVSTGTLSFRTTAARSSTGTHTFASGTALGLGFGGAGQYTAAEIQQAFGLSSGYTGNLANISIGSTNNISIDTVGGVGATLSVNIGSSARGLEKIEGGANLTLTGANQYSGRTVVWSGSALLVNSLGNKADASSNVGTNGTIDIRGGRIDHLQAFSSDKDFNLLGNGTFFGSTTVVATLSGTVSTETAGLKTFTLSGNAGTAHVFSGSITDGSGQLALTKGGATTWTLSGNSSYTGGTTLSLGTLNINSATAIGAGALTMGATGVVVDNTSGSPLTIANGLNMNGVNWTFTGTNNLTIQGAVTQSANNRQITVTNSGARLTLTGNIAAGGASLGVNGAGTLVVTGTNSLTGNFEIRGGTLEVSTIGNGGIPSSLGASAAAATGMTFFAPTATLRYMGGAAGNTSVTTDRSFTLSSGAGGGATIESSAPGTGTLSFNNTNALSYGTGNETRTLTLGGTNTGANTFEKIIANNGTGATSLTKVGAGTWVLSQNNTYTGATAVNGGKLVLTTSLAASAVAVSGTGTILATDAAASFGGTLAINSGAILAPGDAGAAGTATVTGASTFNNGSIFSWDINAAGTGYDKLITSGLVDGLPAGGSTFRLVVADTTFGNAFWNTDRTWTDIFTTNGTTPISGWAAIFNTLSVVNSTFAPLDTSAKGTFSAAGNTLTWTAVPEPTSALAGLLLGAGLLRRRRK